MKTVSLTILIAMFTFAIRCPSANAQTVILPHRGRGWYDQTGFLNQGSLNYFVGEAGGTTARNFFLFDLAPVVQPIESATLVLFVPSSEDYGFSSPDLSENYELHDVSTPIITLATGAGGVAAYNDLGTGLVYGSRTMTAADMGTLVEITLNPAAIAALDSATGIFAIGGLLTTLDNVANHEFTFGNTGNVSCTTELRLTLVPEPSTLSLLGIGAISFLATKRKAMQSMPPNHALQRTRPSRSGCSRRVPWAGSLSLGR